tara:strand:- start:144 stop:260 length:117 start_codon:yes stop_codon:yes gene_type:complete
MPPVSVDAQRTYANALYPRGFISFISRYQPLRFTESPG